LTNRALQRQIFPGEIQLDFELWRQSSGGNAAIGSFVLGPIWNRLIDGQVSWRFGKARFSALSASLRWP